MYYETCSIKKAVPVLIAIGMIFASCTKSYNGHRDGSAGTFIYTVTDTMGVSYSFSDTSYLVNTAPWDQIPFSINENGAGVPLPAGYVDSTEFNYHPGDTSKIFYFQDAHTISQNDTNILRFSVPWFQETLTNNPNSFNLTLNNTLYSNDSVTATYPYRSAVSPFIWVTATTINTAITDSSKEHVTGTFNITVTTNTSKTIAIKGSFTGIPIIY